MSEIIQGALKIRQRMGISEATFIDLVHNHGLPAKKDGNQFSIGVADLEKWEQRSMFVKAPKWPLKAKPKKAELPKKDVSATPRGRKKRRTR